MCSPQEREVVVLPHFAGRRVAGHHPLVPSLLRVRGRTLPIRRLGRVRDMSALRFRGPVLPDGEVRDLYVVDGRVTYERVASAEHVAEGWIVPGLVDAHCHVGLDESGAVPPEVQEA